MIDDQQRARASLAAHITDLRAAAAMLRTEHPRLSGLADEFDLAADELNLVAAALRAAPEGFVLVPVEPSLGVLASMAIRRDHGLGCPGYYDAPVFGAENVGHQRRMEVAIGEARQQYEEVVGTGFYSLDREGHYAGLAARPQGVKDAT